MPLGPGHDRPSTPEAPAAHRAPPPHPRVSPMPQRPGLPAAPAGGARAAAPMDAADAAGAGGRGRASAGDAARPVSPELAWSAPGDDGDCQSIRWAFLRVTARADAACPALAGRETSPEWWRHACVALHGHRALGAAWYACGDRAVKDVEEGGDLDAHLAASLYNSRSVVELDLGLWEDAEASLAKADAHHPDVALYVSARGRRAARRRRVCACAEPARASVRVAAPDGAPADRGATAAAAAALVERLRTSKDLFDAAIARRRAARRNERQPRAVTAPLHPKQHESLVAHAAMLAKILEDVEFVA
ncbi:hypothetical protein SO694_00053048 [Aureococcus anophagefferens]|uniref:Uncharacterized protein n=1 Tax=Aureococcus anophagefferens TaxID=44056 RepID=A0ABR1FXS9_AURAN